MELSHILEADCIADQGVISVINTLPQFHAVIPRAETAFGKGFMTGMLLLGAFVGCWFYPYIADRWSRKKALLVSSIIFVIGGIMMTAAYDYGTLVAGRAIGGVGTGTLALGAPLVCMPQHLYCIAADTSKVYIGSFTTPSPWHAAGA